MRKIIFILALLTGIALSAEAPVVSNTTASQRDDGSRKMDIYYNLYDADGDEMTIVMNVSDDNGATWNLSCNLVTGDIGPGIYSGNGKHIVWDVLAEHPNMSGDDFRFKITADDGQTPVPDGFVYVPAGSFEMGRTGVATPIHTVNLDAFYIGTFELTIAEYLLFMNEVSMDISGAYNGNQCVTQINGDSGIYRINGEYVFQGGSYNTSPNCPMIYVSWFGAVEYCNWLSQIDGYTPCYTISGATVTCNWSADGYRLPTEAEWEYSARGATNTPDYTYAGSNDCDDVAWYSSNSSGHAHPVGEKQANGIGTYDQSGNVLEWCWDWSTSFDNLTEPDNPHGPDTGTRREIRGGYFSFSSFYCQIAFRAGTTPASSGNSTGFRIVRNAE